MANHHLKLGDTVKLSEDSEWLEHEFGHFNYDMNPTNVTGVVSLPEYTGWVTVCWDNGHKNHYREDHEDLILIGGNHG